MHLCIEYELVCKLCIHTTYYYLVILASRVYSCNMLSYIYIYI